MAPHVGARCLEKENGGRGVLLGGVPGRAAGGRRDPRRRRRRHPCRHHQRRHGRHRHRGRPQSGGAAPHRQSARRARAHRVLDPRCGRGAVPARRSRHRHRAGARRRGAEADHRRDRQGDEARLGHRRRRDRPGRLLGDLAADHAFEPDLPGRRRRALLRDQHAGRGRAHLDLRAQQRDAAVRAGARRRRAGAARSARTRICATA